MSVFKGEHFFVYPFITLREKPRQRAIGGGEPSYRVSQPPAPQFGAGEAFARMVFKSATLPSAKMTRFPLPCMSCLSLNHGTGTA